MKAVLVVLLAVSVLLGLGWAVQGNAFFMYRFFAPRVEAVRRETFEQSRAFNQGTIHELESLQFEYIQVDSVRQPALATIILNRASGYDLSDPAVPQSLRSFIDELKRDRGLTR